MSATTPLPHNTLEAEVIHIQMPSSRPIHADVLPEGVLISFSNGEEGLYSTELLLASLSEACASLSQALQRSALSDPDIPMGHSSGYDADAPSDS